jgi:hypothetical protein
MASSGTPSSFDAAAVRAGLLTAMNFGLPTVANDQPTFFMPQTVTSVDPLDGEGVPFDPDSVLTTSVLVKKRAPCAVEYVDGDGKVETFAVVNPSKIKLTFLDTDYDTIKGFLYCVIEGQKYHYARTEPPVALGTIDVYTVHCKSEDEG